MILLVDDEAILLLSLKQSLRLRYGEAFRYETALDGDEALKLAGEASSSGDEVALVITDWLMPGMSGAAFLERIREGHPSAKLILLTGHSRDPEIAELVRAGELDAFIQKPWTPGALFSAVEKAIPPAVRG